MQHGCVAVQVGNARGGLTIAAREGVPKEQIILGEILEPLGTHLSLQGGPGGEFIYSDPGYTALIDSAVAVGGRAIGVPLNSRLENDLPAITAKVSQRSRAVFLVNPHNPTGIAGDTGQLKAFARTVSRQALVIVDEAYLEFADQFTQRTLAGCELRRRSHTAGGSGTREVVPAVSRLEIEFHPVQRQLRILRDRRAAR